MDLPDAPKDISLKNIIDKLAEFVARNGPEFEAITKTKQQGNPKFSFLYAGRGEHYQYYKWRVATEQSILKQQGSISQAQNSQPSPSISGNNNNNNIPLSNTTIPNNNVDAQQLNNQTMHVPNIMSQQQQQQQQNQQMWNNGPQHAPVANNATNSQQLPMLQNPQIDALNNQQIQLREQILQSEQNLAAQHGVLLQQQQQQIDDAIVTAQHESLKNLAKEYSINLPEFDGILKRIIDSCTKDSISAGKNWILQHTSDSPKCNVILQYLLKKALVIGAPFTQKLHLIYLVNDVLHHCVRKRADDLKNNLENIVIPMFCSGQIIATEDQKAKLTKLLSLWESKANFFDACVISKLRSPNSSMQEYKTNLMNTHSTVVAAISQATKATFDNYNQQHQAFIQHAHQQIALLETQKQALELQQSKLTAANQIPPLMPPGVDVMSPQQQQPQPQMTKLLFSNSNLNNGNSNMSPAPQQKPQQRQSTGPVPLMSQPVSMPDMNMPPPPKQQQQQQMSSPYGSNVNNMDISHFQNPEPPPSLFNQSQQQNSSYGQPPPNFLIPDLSRPPPGFLNQAAADASAADGSGFVQEAAPPPMEIIMEEIRPTVPYYELPAGLMVPLIRLEDYEYKPLNPDDLRLPPPIPPSERLIGAIEAFYALPSHDRPRDGEGWEKLGLYEYYKVKNAAKKTKEEEIEKGVREKSRSPSPILIEFLKTNKPSKRVYRSKSRSKSRSRSRSRSRSKSPTPPPPQPSPMEQNRKMRKSNNFSAKKSSSPLLMGKRDRDRGSDRNRDRDSSASPPPSFFGGGNYQKPQNECIEESNKGHQMLMKMGWAGSGTGLGTHGQGIDTPISGGEVRDRQDQFKGVGINLNDPYENFRKNKGQAFIHRMRSRDHDRKSNKNHSPESQQQHENSPTPPPPSDQPEQL